MRRFTSCLSLVVLLAAQSLPPVHRHAHGGEPAGHDACLHVHFDEQAHSEHDSPDHHDSDHDSPAVDECFLPGHGSSHDADAFYFERDGLAQRDGGPSAVDFPVTCFSACFPAWSTFSLPPPEAVAEPPPDRRLCGPPLYLRELSLRI
jgi:hypothetical protein